MSDRESEDEAVLIPWQELSPEALDNILEDLVTRGEPDEISVATRCSQLLSALRHGRTELYFHPIEESIFLRNRVV